MSHIAIQPVSFHQIADFPEARTGKEKSRAIELILPDCEIFSKRLFEGESFRTSFRVPNLGGEWKNRFSSIIIHHGVWRFYRRPDFQEPYSIDLGPGHYAYLGELGWTNADCASFEPVAW